MEGLLVGLTLGLAAGLSPGPLLTLVVTATLRRGFGAGLRLASVPLITDLPIVVMALFVASSVPTIALDVLALVGGLVVLWIAFETFREARSGQPIDTGTGGLGDAAVGHDLRRGVLVNVISPHPWVFWLSIGGPLVVGWWRGGMAWSAISFLTGFYVTLVGSKIALAGIVAKGRRRLGGRGHRIILGVCAAALIVLGSALAFDGGRGLLLNGARA